MGKKFRKTLGHIDPLFAAIAGQPKSPKLPEPPPAAPAPPPPPAAPTPAEVPEVPTEAAPAAQAAMAETRAEADERRRRSTFLTGAGGISKEKFGNPQDIKKANLFGGGSRGY